MIISYVGPNPGTNQPCWDIRPSGEHGSEECRFLSVLRDLALKPGVFIRITGTEDGEVTKPGLPAKPVRAMSIVIEDQGHPVREKPLGLEADPKRPVVIPDPTRFARPPRREEEVSL